MSSPRNGPTLVLGGTGKTGRRIAANLEARGIPVRIGSRGATPPFDWNREAGWDACLRDVEAAYVSYAPDLAIPGATDSIRALVDRAKHHGVRRLVLLSGRGEAEAQKCERIVRESGLDWTIVRASWFHQNFSEGAFVDMVRAGRITLPSGARPRRRDLRGHRPAPADVRGRGGRAVARHRSRHRLPGRPPRGVRGGRGRVRSAEGGGVDDGLPPLHRAGRAERASGRRRGAGAGAGPARLLRVRASGGGRGRLGGVGGPRRPGPGGPIGRRS